MNEWKSDIESLNKCVYWISTHLWAYKWKEMILNEFAWGFVTLSTLDFTCNQDPKLLVSTLPNSYRFSWPCLQLPGWHGIVFWYSKWLMSHPGWLTTSYKIDGHEMYFNSNQTLASRIYRHITIMNQTKFLKFWLFISKLYSDCGIIIIGIWDRSVL